MNNHCSARRRAILGAGLALVGGVLCAQSAAQAKASKAQVKYQESPKGGQRCDGCLHFDGLDSCKLVDGKISPSGWCSLYAAKPR